MSGRFVIMGVSGSGKSSVGAGFAALIGAEYVDGDDLHPAINVAKMTAGTPLTDADRAPWLERIGRAFYDRDLPLVIGCSALRRSYRDLIRDAAGGDVSFILLHGSREVIAARMARRKDHFMPPALLDSQLSTLEVPGADESSFTVDIDQTLQGVIGEIVSHYQLRRF